MDPTLILIRLDEGSGVDPESLRIPPKRYSEPHVQARNELSHMSGRPSCPPMRGMTTVHSTEALVSWKRL